jgi:hypothetical protein
MSQNSSRCSPQWRPDVDLGPSYVRFMDEVALRHVFLREFPFPSVNVIPPMLHTHFHVHSAAIRNTRVRSLWIYKEFLSIKNDIIFTSKKKFRLYFLSKMHVICQTLSLTSVKPLYFLSWCYRLQVLQITWCWVHSVLQMEMSQYHKSCQMMREHLIALHYC